MKDSARRETRRESALHLRQRQKIQTLLRLDRRAGALAWPDHSARHLVCLGGRRREAQEFIRQRQQGLGRPILATKLGDHQLVTVGKAHYQSAHWKTFPDFLDDYIRRVLDPAWGNALI